MTTYRPRNALNTKIISLEAKIKSLTEEIKTLKEQLLALTEKRKARRRKHGATRAAAKAARVDVDDDGMITAEEGESDALVSTGAAGGEPSSDSAVALAFAAVRRASVPSPVAAAVRVPGARAHIA